VSPALVPFLAIVVIVAIDLWVYLDAKRHVEHGAPVELTIGALVVDTPAAWFLACLILWVIFLPLYLVSRREG
jgi:hypothetical protein